MKQYSARSFITLIFLYLLIACNSARENPRAPVTTTRVPAIEDSLPTPTEASKQEIATTPLPLAELDFLAKSNPPIFRVMSYNVNWDSIFPAGDRENHVLRIANRELFFQNLLATVQPDIVCLQEINPDRDPQQVSELIAQVLSTNGDAPWEATSARDSVIATRFPLRVEGFELSAPGYPRDLGQAAALIDLPDERYGALDLYVLCAHFKSGGSQNDIDLRQRQADVVTQQLGDAITPGGSLDLPEGTPLIVMGDFNAYDTDPAHHLTTLLSGDIADEERYGPDLAPDWDGTGLDDALPSHNASGETYYTWRDDSGQFNPWPLDRILFSDSALAIENAFVFNTDLLSEEALEALNLHADDIWLNRTLGVLDHLPLVVDFVINLQR